MKLKVYSVKDTKADEFGPLFLVKNDELAKRGFLKEMEKSEYVIEYDLYCVAYFDTETGKFSVPSDPVIIMTGNQVFDEIMEKAGDNAVQLRLKEIGDAFYKLSPEEQNKLVMEIKERGYKK